MDSAERTFANWRFEPKRRSQKSRDPMQASFFTNASIDDDTHALVREAIQNSLDAKKDRNSCEPVRVRFHIDSHSAESGVMNRYLTDEAWEHFNAEDNGLASPPLQTDDCRFLVYEDFNTEGLIGNEMAFEEETGNSFYFFMRAEGQSGKQKGERGRHGIGKYVFPYTSGIRMFIAATVRNSDGRCLVAGQSVLKSHQVRGQHFTPDGWWGSFEQDGEDDYFQLPVDSNELFHQLKNDFGLERQIDQSGLSLVMPFVQEEVTGNKITEHVIREYFWPILNSHLVVSVVEGGEEKVIDAVTIHENLDELLPQELIDSISPYVNLAVKVLGDGHVPVIELTLPENPALPRWDNDYLSKELADVIHAELGTGNTIICIRCPLHVHNLISGTITSSHFDIYLLKDLTDLSRKPRFIREGITIPEDRVPTVRGYTSLVVIEPGDLATLLGDSENPAHTEWEKNSTKFKGKYKWGPTTIDFVRHGVVKLLKLMSQGDEDKDVNLLSDIFYINLPENEEEVPESRKKRERKKAGTEPEPPPTPPPSSKPRTYRLSKKSDGFVLSGPEEPLGEPRMFKVKVAYDVAGASKARALKLYHKNDFDLEKGKNVQLPVFTNVERHRIVGNAVVFIALNNEFSFEVGGFDQRRDIIVDVQSEAVKNEAI